MLESSHSGLQNASSVDIGFSGWEWTKHTNVSSTGEWYLAVGFSPRARKAKHTAKASGADAFWITRDSHQADHQASAGCLKLGDGLDLHFIHDQKNTPRLR